MFVKFGIYNFYILEYMLFIGCGGGRSEGCWLMLLMYNVYIFIKYVRWLFCLKNDLMIVL